VECEQFAFQVAFTNDTPRIEQPPEGNEGESTALPTTCRFSSDASAPPGGDGLPEAQPVGQVLGGPCFSGMAVTFAGLTTSVDGWPLVGQVADRAQPDGITAVALRRGEQGARVASQKP
jgi:hypothetical protein